MDPLLPVIVFTVALLCLTLVGSVILLMQSRKLRTELKDVQKDDQEHADRVRELTSQLSSRNKQDEDRTLTDTVVSGIHAGIIALDASGNVILVNPYAAKFLASSPSEMRGEAHDAVLKLTADEDANPTAMIRESLTGKPLTFPQWTYITVKGEQKPITGSVTPLLQGGQSNGAVIVFQDGSLAHYMEEEEKTFLSAAAHELRSPMTSIQAAISLLLDDFDNTPPQKTKEILTQTNEYVNRLIALVNDFLNVTRLRRRKVTIVKEPFDIVGLTTQVIDQYRILAQQKHLSLYHEANAPATRVMGDDDKAREVIANLISNAIKYTQQGTITVKHEASDGKIATKVIDTGVGIDPRYHKLLFGKFSQIGQGHKLSSIPSTGLGLFIARQFAQLMGGDVVLEKSEPTRGSTFSFTLPVARE